MEAFVHIGADTIFQASSVGSYVSIGRNCVVVSRHSMSSLHVDVFL